MNLITHFPETTFSNTIFNNYLQTNQQLLRMGLIIDIGFFVIIIIVFSILGIVLSMFVIQPIISRKKLQHEADYHMNYMSLVDNYSGMAYRCLDDQFWTMKYVSPKVYELTGYTESEIIDNKFIAFEEIILPKYREFLHKRWAEVLESHEDFSEDYVIITKQNIEKWVHEDGHGIFDSKGNIAYIEGFIRDITEQKNILVRERKNQAKYRSLIENSQDAIYIDENGIITYANPACLAFFKASSIDQILEKPVDTLIDDKYVQFYHDRVNRLVATHLANPAAEYEFKCFDGSIAYAEVSSAPYFDDNRFAIHVFIHDITQQIKKENELKKSQKRNRDLILEMKEGIGVFQMNALKTDAVLVFQNKGLPNNLYGKYQKMINTTFSNIFTIFSDEEVKEIFSVISSGEVLQKQIVMSDRIIVLRFFTNVDHELVMMASDITESSKQLREIEKQASRLEQIIKATNVGTWEWIVETGEEIVNDRWASLIGYQYDELIPYTLQSWEERVHPDDFPIVNEILGKHLRQEVDTYQAEYRVKHKDGHYVWINDKGTVSEWSQDGKPVRMFGTHSDITERIQKQIELEYVSYRDFLTGLHNRRSLVKHINQLKEKSRMPISIAMADVNGLKITNDAFGHAAGDKLLKFVANTLTEYFKEDSFVARTGGDEFTIIKENTDLFQMHAIIDEISSVFQNTLMNGIKISVAFGASMESHSINNFDSVIRNAEIEMYSRKMNSTIVKRSETINTILETLFERSPEERNHAQKVSALAKKFATVLNLSLDEIEIIKTLGYLHDIGKVALDQSALMSQEAVTPEVMNEIRSHAEIGYRLLLSTNEYKHIAQDILHHHEYWDGSGYPLNLKGEEIPLRSRILNICNEFDQMTSGYHLQQKMSIQAAIKTLMKESGRQFDPKLTKVFIEKMIPSLTK